MDEGIHAWAVQYKHPRLGACMNALADRIEHLIAASDAAQFGTFSRVCFADQLDADRCIMPEHLLSLYHHPVYSSLSSGQKWQLGLLETVNFFSINIHGERNLVAGLAERLYRGKTPWDSHQASRYLQRFIHEENSHSHMLAEYCHRYHGRVMPDNAMKLDHSALSPIAEDLLFFGRTMVLEGFLDYVNTQAIRDPELDPTTQAVHRAHHSDESRHITFDRAVIAAIVEHLRDADEIQALQTVSAQLNRYLQVSMRRLCSAGIYRSIGLSNGFELCQQVRALPERLVLEERWMASTCGFLQRLGLNMTNASQPAEANP
jgi:hypothetical protein